MQIDAAAGLDEINAVEDRAAAALLLPLAERAPELAAAAAAARPFADAAALAAALQAALEALSEPELLDLFRRHPPLAPAKPEEMTAESRSEQARLGLSAPEGSAADRLDALNRAYAARFGFPFIIALHKHADLGSVFSEFERRIGAPRAVEIIAARAEIASVTRARVRAAYGDPGPAAAGGVSIHAVDVASGRPAEGLEVRLLRRAGGEEADAESLIAAGRCGRTGLFDHPSVQGAGIAAGRYVAEFEVGAWHRAQGLAAPGFLETVRFDFGVPRVEEHFHLPFKFTAWGYSMFRGGL